MTKSYLIQVRGAVNEFSSGNSYYIRSCEDPRVAAALCAIMSFSGLYASSAVREHIVVEDTPTGAVAKVTHGKPATYGDPWIFGDGDRLLEVELMEIKEAPEVSYNVTVFRDEYDLADGYYDELVQHARAVAAKPRTAAEIAELKESWASDPHWDIEDTDGFEAHYDELKAYHDARRAEWQRRRDTADAEGAAQLGCSIELYRYIKGLEHQIEHLRGRMAA